MLGVIEKAIFKIIGIRLKFIKKDDSTTIIWSRMSFLEILLFFVMFMSAIYGIASYLEWKEVMGLEVLPFSMNATIIFWSIIGLLALHLFFNRSSKFQINKFEFNFQKRPFFPIKHKHNVQHISSIDLKLQNSNYDNDSGIYNEIYDVTIYLAGSKKLILDGFNEADSLKIKSVIQEYIEMKK